MMLKQVLTTVSRRVSILILKSLLDRFLLI